MPDPSWKPTVENVGALIRARTKVRGGAELGTFTPPGDVRGETRPTQEQAESVIDQAVDHVQAAVGGEPCNASLKESAGAAATMLAAILIETSFYPEQTDSRTSAASRLETLFNARMKSLTAAVSEQCGGQGEGGGEDGGNSGALAAGHFSDGYALIGRDYPPRW